MLAAFAGGGAVAWHLYNAPGPLARETDVVVPHGDLHRVTAALAQAGVIDRPLVFRLAAILTAGAGPLHAAELAFPAHASIAAALAVLRTAPPVQRHLTIPEGLTARQIAALVNAAPGLTGAVAAPAEGSVLPQTYAYEYGMSREAVLRRAERAMTHTLAELWKARAPDLPISTPEQAVILASIVERETARADERPMVAAVYLNRLKRGMRLQADPTVVYAASDGAGELGRPLSRADLERADPYNTYRNGGLPPGPICAPGVASLTAVLHPAQTDALYFVADGSGGHVFARTLDEHARNVARWRALNAAPQNH